MIFYFIIYPFWLICPVGWGCRIRRLHLSRGVRHPKECPGNNTKQSDGVLRIPMTEVPVMGIRSTPSLPSLTGLLWPGVVAADRVLSMGQIELNCVLMLNWITWNRTVLIFKLHTYAKLSFLNRAVLTFNCVWTKTILILNWIVWIRTVWLNWKAWARNVFLTIELCTHAKLNCLK